MDDFPAQSDWPSQRMRRHMFYTVEASAKALSEEVRTMVANAW